MPEFKNRLPHQIIPLRTVVLPAVLSGVLYRPADSDELRSSALHRSGAERVLQPIGRPSPAIERRAARVERSMARWSWSWSWHEAIERRLEAGFQRLGLAIARQPLTAVCLPLVLTLGLSAGLLQATFLTAPELLYVPQHSEMALQRHEIRDFFGRSPEPGMFIARANPARRTNSSVLTLEGISELFKLHEAVLAIEARLEGGTLSFEDACSRRYVAEAQQRVCLMTGLLELWFFKSLAFEADPDWEGHLARVLATSDFYALGLLDSPPGGPVSAQAIELSYYFDASTKVYAGAGVLAWEDAVVRLLAERNVDPKVFLFVDYWSTLMNERDASAVVTKDYPVLVCTFMAVFAYVCVALGALSCDRRRSRYALGMCGVVVGLAISSAFGLCALMGVPLAPMSLLVVFILVGVSVDDMVIIVDSFDRTQAALPIDERAGFALQRAGPAISLTSLTTAIALLSGCRVDLPSVWLFCFPGAMAVLLVNILQPKPTANNHSNGHADVELVDALEAPPGHSPNRNNLEAAEPGAVSPLPSTMQQGWHCSRSRRPISAPSDIARPAPAPCGLYPAGRDISPIRPSPMPGGLRVHALAAGTVALLLWVAALGVAVWLIPRIKLGLPIKLTLPSDSESLSFLLDSDKYYGGAQEISVQVILRSEQLASSLNNADVEAALAEMRALPFVNRDLSDWRADYLAWHNCSMAVLGQAQLPTNSAVVYFADLESFLADGRVHICREGAAYDDPAASPNAIAAEGAETTAAHSPNPERKKWRSGPAEAPSVSPPPLFSLTTSASDSVDGVKASFERQKRHGGHGCLLSAKTLSPEPCVDVDQWVSQVIAKAIPLRTITARWSDLPVITFRPLSTPPPSTSDCLPSLNPPPPAQLSGGYTCADVASACLDAKGGLGQWLGAVVSAYCAATCGRCVPDAKKYAPLTEGETVEISFGGLGHAPDLVRAREGSTLVASRYVISVSLPPEHGVDGFVYHYRFEFSATDQAMSALVRSNFLFAAGAMVLLLWLFLPLHLALLCVVTVLWIDTLVLGLMALTGMRLNCMSAVTLLIALGLSIDYTCHIVHAFQRSRQQECRKRLEEALSFMGLSTLSGGASTLLGTLFLSASRAAPFKRTPLPHPLLKTTAPFISAQRTPVFRTVFVLLWSTVALGLLTALFVVPAVLLLFDALIKAAKGPFARGEPPPLGRAAQSTASQLMC
ncbi:patched family-domain-containing protein [Pavlovales sp. CCMP2436]|nr:patched family-domain-containing protein [Pavlovales sp. CCMP2436]